MVHAESVATEIERKFLVAAPPPREASGRAELRQGYVAEDGPVSVRVRITEQSALLTVKAGRGRSRTEVEVPLSMEEADALWACTEGRRLSKTRLSVPLGDDSDGAAAGGALVAELDVYHGALAGIRTVEVEFESEAAAERFHPPAWFGREVTGDPAWTNAALARRPR